VEPPFLTQRQDNKTNTTNMKIIDKVNAYKDRISRQLAYAEWATQTFRDIEIAEDASIDLGCEICYINIHNRTDLQTLLKLAPKWDKSPSGKAIQYYNNNVNGESVYIFAYDAALPPTCKVIREEKIIPARGEYIEVTERILCDV